MLSLVNNLRSGIWSVFSVAICAAGTQMAWAADKLAAGEAAPKLIWETEISEPKSWSELQAACLNPVGELLLIYAVTPGPLSVGPPTNQLQIVRLEANGRVVHKNTLEKPKADSSIAVTNFSLSEARSVVSMGEGYVAAVEFAEQNPWLIHLDKDGKQLSSNRIASSLQKCRINKLFTSIDQKFVLLGHNQFNALSLRCELSGKVEAESSVDFGAMDFYLDGLLDEKGPMCIVGNSGVYDMIGRGRSIVVLRSFRTSSEPSQKTFTGRRGALASFGNGAIAVVYDRSETDLQQIRLKFLESSSLKEKGDYEVCEGFGGNSNFKVTRARNGSLLIGGSRNGQLFLVTFDEKGVRLWSSIIESLPQSTDYELFGDGSGNFYVAFSFYADDPETRITRKIKVLKFKEPIRNTL